MMAPRSFFAVMSITLVGGTSFAGVTIRPGQTIEAGGIQVSCVGNSEKPKNQPGKPALPPSPPPTFEVFYCSRPGANFVLKKNRYQYDGKIVASGIEVFQADNKTDCYNALKEKRQAVPKNWNFTCACDEHRWGYGQSEEMLVKKVYGPNGLVDTIGVEVGRWDQNDPVCADKIAFTRANDPTCY